MTGPDKQNLVLLMFFLNKSRLQPAWALGLLAIPLLGWSQTASADADKAWLQANELVGQFRRGHADVLRWEQAQMTTVGSVPAVTVHALDLTAPETAVELAWKAHQSSTAPTLAHLGREYRALLLTGRWDGLNVAQIAKLEGLDQVVDLAIAARKAWLQATASRMALVPAKVALDAAQVAEELGQRMVAVGNWSKLAQIPQQQAWATAQLNWHRAQYTAAQDQAKLLQLLELSGQYPAVQLPTALPTVPKQAMAEDTFNARLQETQAQVHTWRRPRHRAVTQLAYQAYLSSHAVATITEEQVVRLQDLVTEESQLHYNGMLKSTWDLLGEIKKQAQARSDLMTAQRNFAFATLDLASALLGNEPEALVSLGGGSGDPEPKAH